MRKLRSRKTTWKKGMAVLLAAMVAAQIPMSYVPAAEEQPADFTAVELSEAEAKIILETEQETENTEETGSEAAVYQEEGGDAEEEMQQPEEIVLEAAVYQEEGGDAGEEMQQSEEIVLEADAYQEESENTGEEIQQLEEIILEADAYQEESENTETDAQPEQDEGWILGDEETEVAEFEIFLSVAEDELQEGDSSTIIWDNTKSYGKITAGGSYKLSDILGNETSPDKHIKITTTEAVVLDGENITYSALTISACKNSNLTIKDLNIADTKTGSVPPYGAATQTKSYNPLVLYENAVLTVKGTNNLSGNYVWNLAGGAVLISGANVRIRGDGILNVTSNNTNVAAIGLDPYATSAVSNASWKETSSAAASVIIEDKVVINAESKNTAAVAIGTRGASGWSGTNAIRIEGDAQVTATSASSSSGTSVALGGCAQSYSTNLEIYIGGNAKVTTNNKSSAGTVTKPQSVGIGVGSVKTADSIVNITIAENAQVTGSGICAGTNALSSITVTGGTVQLTSTKEFALLAHQITVSGGELTVTGVKASAIAGDIIDIKGGTITATGSAGFAGIGMYATDNPVGITISGGNVKATGGNSAAGIGAINKSTVSGQNTITITGGTVWAKGGGTYSDSSGAGIGGAVKTSGGKIQIGQDATVTAIGGRVDGAFAMCESTAKGIGAGGSCDGDTTSLAISKGARILCFSPDKSEGTLAMPKCTSDEEIGIWGQFAQALEKDTTVKVYFDGRTQGEEVVIPCYTSSFAFTTCSSVTLEKEGGEIIELPGENTMGENGVYGALEWKSAAPSLEGAVLTISNVIENREIAFAGDKTFTYTVTALAGALTNGEYDLSASGAQTQVAEVAIAYRNGAAEEESAAVTLPSMTSGSTWYYLVRGSYTEEDMTGTWSYDCPYLVKVTVNTDENGKAVGTVTICRGIVSGTTFSLLPGAEEEESSEVVFTNVYEEYREYGDSALGVGEKELSDGVHTVGAYTYLDTDAWYEQIEDAEEKYTLVHGHYDAENDLFYYIIPQKAYDKVVLDGTQYVECLIARYTNSNWSGDPSPWNPGSMKNIPWCVINDSGSTYDYEDCGFYLSDSESGGIDARYYLDEVEPRSAAAAATASGSGVADFRKVLRTASTPLQYLYGPVAGTDAEARITTRAELESAIVPVGIWQIYHAEEKVQEVYGGKYTYEQYILHFYNDILQAGYGAESIAQLPLSCRMNLLGYAYMNGLGISESPWNLFNIGNYTMSLNAYQEELIEQMAQAASVYESADMGTYRLYGMIEPSVEIQNMAYQSFYRDALKFTFDYERDSELLISSQSSFTTAIYATEIMGWSTLCALTQEQAFLADNLDQAHDSTEQAAVDSIAATVGTIHILGGYDAIFNNSLLSLQGLTTPNAYYGAAMLYGLGMDITLRANREEYDFGLQKKDEEGTQLGGAVFALSLENGDAVSFIRTETDDAVIYTYTADAAQGSTDEIVSVADKETAVYGLPQGNYYLQETKTAADRYALSGTVYKIEVTTAEEDGQEPEPLIRVYECGEGTAQEQIGYTQESQGARAVIEVVNLWNTVDTTLRIVKKVIGSMEFSGTEEFSFTVSELADAEEQENGYTWKLSSVLTEAVKVRYQSEEPEKAFAEIVIEGMKYGSVHYYLIREEDLQSESWSCDKSVWLVKVTVDDEGGVAKVCLAGTEEDGTFRAAEPGKEEAEAEFTNTYLVKETETASENETDAAPQNKTEKETESVTEEETEEETESATEEETEEETESDTEKKTETGTGTKGDTSSGMGAVRTEDETQLALYVILLAVAALFLGEETFRRRKSGKNI